MSNLGQIIEPLIQHWLHSRILYKVNTCIPVNVLVIIIQHISTYSQQQEYLRMGKKLIYVVVCTNRNEMII